MAPFYEELCPDVGWLLDQSLLEKMKNSNKTELEKLEKNIEDATTNLGETVVRDQPCWPKQNIFAKLVTR